MVDIKSTRVFKINDRIIGDDYPPFVVAEIGINHGGSMEKALKMVEQAAAVGCECIKFQCHIVKDEMIPNAIIPSNASESIWDIMERCSLSYENEKLLKSKTEKLGMIFLSTPFSREAADRLNKMDVKAFKIGSGECNNIPLLKHIAGFKKPVILSTGMNDLDSVARSVAIFSNSGISVALLHCTSIYPTPYRDVRLGALTEMRKAFPQLVIGLSDHTTNNYVCFGAVSLGARILERHFTSDKNWPGPDMPISMDPVDLKDLIQGSRAIFEASGGKKNVLNEEEPTIKFAFGSVVTISNIKKGEVLSRDNIWVKRPGTGEIRAEMYDSLIGRHVINNIPIDKQLRWGDLEKK